MYKVLLVDDEPLVLAGIKMMIDWEANDCQLVGSARNGRQALEAMEELRPDIVIADINMPVMDGIELLRQAEEQYPAVVFLMLTNMQEFELAREALRHKAAEYLVKNQLEPELLLESLNKAKAESAKRRHLNQADIVGDYLRTSQNQLLRESLERFVAPGNAPEAKELLQKSNMLGSRYMLVEVQFHYPYHFGDNGTGKEDLARLVRWEQEVVEELARNCFRSFLSTEPGVSHPNLLLLVYNSNSDSYGSQLESFRKKLAAASANITGIRIGLLATDIFNRPDGIDRCREEILALREAFYTSGAAFLRYSDISPREYQQLALSGIAGRLKAEIRSKNAGGCAALLERAIARVKEVSHEKAQGLWLCTDLYTAATETLEKMGTALPEHSLFASPSVVHAQIQALATRAEVLQFLEAMKNELSSILLPLSSRHTDIVEQAKQYVLDNIDKKIMLQDAARYICISPGYLSAIFKKQYGENFVDFINRSKMERACQLIRQGDFRISQISYMLSYENAYYFTRVFKRYVGMTPSEYQDRINHGEEVVMETPGRGQP